MPNKRKRDDNDAGKSVGSGVGAVPGDTIASALDPFGSAAGAIADDALDNRAGEATVDDKNRDSEARD